MNPTQAQPGYYWNTNDGAALDFEQAGPEKPTTVRCYMMRDLSGIGGTIDDSSEHLEFMAAGIFGEPRGNRTKWTGDAYRYGIYRVQSDTSTNPVGIVILERHGGGMVGYTFNGHEDFQTWARIVAVSTSEQLWDLCQCWPTACKVSATPWRPSTSAPSPRSASRLVGGGAPWPL